MSDGRSGIEGQVLGLAEAAARLRPAEIAVKRVAWTGWTGRLPWWAHPFPRATLVRESRLSGPWPDLWIAAGRATLPLSVRAGRWSRGRSFVVQVQDPRLDPARFDLVIPPRHDGLAGANVFPITGAPHGVTAERLAEAGGRFASAIDSLPHPRTAVLIGGTSKAFALPPARAAALAREIEQSISEAGGSLMLTFSRRTPDQARALMAARLKGLPGIIWDDQGENPYFAFLAAADHVLVTEDSTNMATQAAATGKPVHILKMDGESARFRRLHAELEARGIARPFTGVLDGWSYPPLAETERAAAEVLRRYDIRRVGA
ncbi:mitochondrial fission ELM1 family protein [Phenylobacterium sp.]|uniref:mitochondrial fission ELM1 family protein n=1 Tax=Phenylobacterium sp. TaxID=1871053 RepID=UPI002F4086A9